MPIQTRSKTRKLDGIEAGRDFLVCLPSEMILEIRLHLPNLADHVHFSQTCRFIRGFYFSKTDKAKKKNKAKSTDEADVCGNYWKKLCYAYGVGPDANHSSASWQQVASSMVSRKRSPISDLDYSRATSALTFEELVEKDIRLAINPVIVEGSVSLAVDIDWIRFQARRVLAYGHSGFLSLLSDKSNSYLALQFATIPPVKQLHLEQSFLGDEMLWSTTCENENGVTVLDLMNAACERPEIPIHSCGELLVFQGFFPDASRKNGILMRLTHYA